MGAFYPGIEMELTMPGTMIRKKSLQMMDIARLYIESGGAEPIDLGRLADFAIDNGHWSKTNLATLRKQICKKKFSRAFREQYHTDSQGRHVRTYHAVLKNEGEGKQRTFWDDMRRASEEHMEITFHQRRTQIVGDCTQLKIDVDSWNDNNSVGGNFQLLLDFTEDAAERTQPTTYRPQQPR